MPAARQFIPHRILVPVVVVLALAAVSMRAVTLDELLGNPNLTPKRFASYFEDFAYEFDPRVQTPAEFLESRSGDCDDYAILADYVLHRHGFDTRLIHVRIVAKVAHAVCYVTQNHAYLDYNNRRYFITLTRSGPSLREIAEKVADSLESNWTSVSEFTFDYQQNRKYFGATVVKTDPSETDADRAKNYRATTPRS